MTIVPGLPVCGSWRRLHKAIPAGTALQVNEQFEGVPEVELASGTSGTGPVAVAWDRGVITAGTGHLRTSTLIVGEEHTRETRAGTATTLRCRGCAEQVRGDP